MSSELLSRFPFRESCQPKYTESSVEAIPTLVRLPMLLPQTPMVRSMLWSLMRRFGVKVLPWSLEEL